MPAAKPGEAVRPGVYGQGANSVRVEQGGKITVRPGDTISKYALALYGNARAGWDDFGRMVGNAPRKLTNVNMIRAGETLVHLPTYMAGSGTARSSDQELLAAQKMLVEEKIKALEELKKSAFDGFREVDQELAKIARNSRNLSFSVDMAAAIFAPIGTAHAAIKIASKGKSTLFKSLKKLSDVEARIVQKAISGWGVIPYNQGIGQGVIQTVSSHGGVTEPNESDGMYIAFGKIFAQKFFNMTSPSFYAKWIAGGDPEQTVKEMRQNNRELEQQTLQRLDAQIAKYRRLKSSMTKSLDMKSFCESVLSCR